MWSSYSKWQTGRSDYLLSFFQVFFQDTKNKGINKLGGNSDPDTSPIAEIVGVTTWGKRHQRGTNKIKAGGMKP